VERDAKYATVGLFALLAIAAAVAFVWWYSGLADRREYARYEIYFFGTVSGLETGSPVRYLGVDVGRVERLSVDPRYPGRVKVVTEIDTSAPISGATRARLGLLGLTGLLFIDLLLDQAASAEQALPRGDQYPVIRSAKGDIEVFLENLPTIVSRAAGVMERLEAVLSDDNLASISVALDNVRKASADLPALSRNVSTLAAELRGSAGEATQLASELRGTTRALQPELAATIRSARTTADRLADVATRVDRLLAGNEAGLSEFTGPGLQELQQLLVDARETSLELRGLARDLRENPAQLIRERPESGVEIKP
jgi:phospholipid/cholesterol/gamma-HCH transport system substrate-binding protein